MKRFTAETQRNRGVNSIIITDRTGSNILSSTPALHFAPPFLTQPARRFHFYTNRRFSWTDKEKGTSYNASLVEFFVWGHPSEGGFRFAKFTVALIISLTMFMLEYHCL